MSSPWMLSLRFSTLVASPLPEKLSTKTRTLLLGYFVPDLLGDDAERVHGPAGENEPESGEVEGDGATDAVDERRRGQRRGGRRQPRD